MRLDERGTWIDEALEAALQAAQSAAPLPPSVTDEFWDDLDSADSGILEPFRLARRFGRVVDLREEPPVTPEPDDADRSPELGRPPLAGARTREP
jgi:hypothetical protein